MIGDILPDQGALGMVKNLIDKDPDLPPQDKETALKLLEQDTIELQEVSKRWESDMKSDSWLSKNTRPMTLIFLTISLVIFILLDGFDISFGIDTGWIAKSLGYDIVEKKLSCDEIYASDEAFFTGTAAEVKPIRDLDGNQIGIGSRGPITEKLQALYFDCVHGRNADYLHWIKKGMCG